MLRKKCDFLPPSYELLESLYEDIQICVFIFNPLTGVVRSFRKAVAKSGYYIRHVSPPPTFCMEYREFHQRDFHGLIVGMFNQICGPIPILVKIGKNKTCHMNIQRSCNTQSNTANFICIFILVLLTLVR
jgi:hypothetical protein